MQAIELDEIIPRLDVGKLASHYQVGIKIPSSCTSTIHEFSPGQAQHHYFTLASLCIRTLDKQLNPSYFDPCFNLLIEFLEQQVEQATFFEWCNTQQDKNNAAMTNGFLEAISNIQVRLVFNNQFEKLQRLLALNHRLTKILEQRISNGSHTFKKFQDIFKNTIKTTHYDRAIQNALMLVKQERFILAEVYITKSIKLQRGLSPADAKKMKATDNILLALVYFKTQRAAAAFDYLDTALQLDAELRKQYETTSQKMDIYHEACLLAGDYLCQNLQAERARHYYHQLLLLQGQHFHLTQLAASKLNSITPHIIAELKQYTQNATINQALTQVRCFPKHNLIGLHFKDSDQCQELERRCKNKYTAQRMQSDAKNYDPNALYITVHPDFNVSDFKKLLKRATTFKQEPTPVVKLKSKTATRPVNHREASSPMPHVEMPHAKLYKRKPNRAKKPSAPPSSISQTFFPIEPKEIKLIPIEFPQHNLVFDPDRPTGVTALEVAGRYGNWFGCINPVILDLIEKENVRRTIEEKFTTTTQLPYSEFTACTKEMKTKSTQLKTNLPYLFKIRLMGTEYGNVRIYAHIIETVHNEQGQDCHLVCFSAINFNAHARHTQPTLYDFNPRSPEPQSPSKDSHMLG